MLPLPDAYLPIPHRLQVSRPPYDWYLPDSQLVHALAPTSEYMPFAQATHASRAVKALYLPLGQAVHSADPAVAYVAAGHVVQLAAMSVEDFPAPQVAHSPVTAAYVPPLHVLQALAATFDTEPREQRLHDVCPTTSWNKLMAHAGQLAPPAAGEYRPTEHVAQEDMPLRACALPAGQLEHTSAPVVLLNLPLPQAVHVVCPDLD